MKNNNDVYTSASEAAPRSLETVLFGFIPIVIIIITIFLLFFFYKIWSQSTWLWACRVNVPLNPRHNHVSLFVHSIQRFPYFIHMYIHNIATHKKIKIIFEILNLMKLFWQKRYANHRVNKVCLLINKRMIKEKKNEFLVICYSL